MILNFSKALFLLIKMNLIILFYKIFRPSKKIIFFYNPNKHITQNTSYIEDLFEGFGKGFLFFFVFNSSHMIRHKHYYIKYNLLKWIYNVDIFFSNLVCDVFTRNSIKIYMHHDIYDTPMVNIEKEQELFNRLIKYDFLFLSNKKNTVMFNNFFTKYNADPKRKIPSLKEVGYIKLDFLKKNIKTPRPTNNTIVIAPTNCVAFDKFSMLDNLKEIIKILLTNQNLKIVFRPHPANRKNHITLEIEKIFKNDKNFKFDISNDYFDTYLNSMCLMTDLSGTAYTYAFLTKKPIIFFSKNEKLINDLEYNKLSFFKDRDKIGVVTKDLNEIKDAIKNIRHTEQRIKISNDLLEKEINYLGKSKERIREVIGEIAIKK